MHKALKEATEDIISKLDSLLASPAVNSLEQLTEAVKQFHDDVIAPALAAIFSGTKFNH